MEEELERANCRDCDDLVDVDELHDVAGQLICEECYYS